MYSCLSLWLEHKLLQDRVFVPSHIPEYLNGTWHMRQCICCMNDSVGVIKYILTMYEILSCLIESIQWFSIASKTELQKSYLVMVDPERFCSSLPIKKRLLAGYSSVLSWRPSWRSLLFIFPGRPWGMCCLSSLTRDWTHAHCLVCSFKVSSHLSCLLFCNLKYYLLF